MCHAPTHLSSLEDSNCPAAKSTRAKPLDALAREIHEELGTRLNFGPEVLQLEGEWWPIMQERRMKAVWIAGVEQGASRPEGSHSNSLGCLEELALLDWIGNDLLIALAVAKIAAREYEGSTPAPSSHLSTAAFRTLFRNSLRTFLFRHCLPDPLAFPCRSRLFSSEAPTRLMIPTDLLHQGLLHHPFDDTAAEVSECTMPKIIGKAS